MSQNISAAAQKKIKQFFAKTAQAYGGEAGQTFAATPSVAQTLNEKIIEDGNWFLGRINILGVKEIKGEKVLMGLTGHVTSRTDTSADGERVPKNLVGLDADGYELFKTDSDVAIRYATIDAWAKFKNFAALYGKQVRKAIGNDRVRIGWHGTSVAADTDPVANPNLEDVNIGWLEQIRTYNAGSQYVLGQVGSEIELGSPDIPNMDTLVYDAIGRLAIPFQEDPDLFVLVSRDLMQAAKGSYYENQGDTPTEKGKLKDAVIVDTYGGLPAIVPPYFPSGTILVTSLDNLAIYYQEDSWRRKQTDNPKKDQYEDYNSRNEGYVVGEFEKCSLVQGITLYVAPVA
jgi:P2 family phage major capsid protein